MGKFVLLVGGGGVGLVIVYEILVCGVLELVLYDIDVGCCDGLIVWLNVIFFGCVCVGSDDLCGFVLVVNVMFLGMCEIDFLFV